MRGHVEVVSLLLEALADADRPRKFDGATPLFLAAGRGFAAVVRRLLLAGGRQERGNRQGLTPLLTAAEPLVRRGVGLASRAGTCRKIDENG